MLELTELELRHQEAPDLQSEKTTPGQPWTPGLTQLLEASFTDLHGGSTTNLQLLFLWGYTTIFNEVYVSQYCPAHPKTLPSH